MYDDEERNTTYQRRYRSRSKSEPRRFPVSFTGPQVFICAIVLLAALIFKLTGGSVYIKFKSQATDIFNKSVTNSQLQQVFSNIKKQFPNAAEVFKNSDSQSNKTSSINSAASSGASGSGTASTGSVSAGAGKTSSKASSNTSSAKSSQTSSKASSGVSTITIGENLNGQGGEDLEATRSPASGLLVPPKTASLGPFRLSFQLIRPVSGKVTSGFGYRINPITKKLSFHTGIDLASPEATPIKAALPGKVAEVGKSVAYGNYILLEHGGGIQTFYGHCEKILKKQGDDITAGAAIATVGSTGWSTGYHVHFEIRINGVRYNPLWLIK
ncbi:MAG TPA: M23 family metallopeptidase [Clostridia bacterium]|nr:M23 family metallopeptidase [Clostridia bacterium]